MDFSLDTLRKVAEDVGEKCRKYNLDEPKWTTYEHTAKAEIYHQLRDEGFKFEELDAEKPVGTRRDGLRYLDLAYKPKKGGEVGVAIQLVPYQTPLNLRKLNDVKAFEKVPANCRKVLVLIHLDNAKTNRSQVVREKLEQLRLSGVEIIDC